MKNTKVMMDYLSALFTILFTAITFSACSSGGQKKLDQKVESETGVATNSELASTGDQTILEAKDLSSDQKSKLLGIRVSVRTKSDELSKESRKLRSVLIKDVVAKEDHLHEIAIIKGRLKEIEDKRLQLLYDGIDQAMMVLGKESSARQRMIEDTLREDRLTH